MADKMLRVSGKGNDGTAKALSVNDKGQVVLGVSESKTKSNISLSKGTFYESDLFTGGGSRIGIVCVSNGKVEISLQWRKANGDYAADQRFMTASDFSQRHYLSIDKLTESFRVLVHHQSESVDPITITSLTITEFS